MARHRIFCGCGRDFDIDYDGHSEHLTEVASREYRRALGLPPLTGAQLLVVHQLLDTVCRHLR